MFGWLRKRDVQGSGRLSRLLPYYVPFTPRHRALNIVTDRLEGPVLTLEQAYENCAEFRAAIPERLDHLRSMLTEIGVDIDQAYSDPFAFVTALHRTLLVELPPLYRRETATQAARELSDRAGPDMVLSFMGDLAMLECDVLMRAKPGCFVGLNLDPGDRDMTSYRRPCLLGLRDTLYGSPPHVFHVEDQYFGYYALTDLPHHLAHPDIVLTADTPPASMNHAIGGTLLVHLTRYETHPALEELKASTWLGEAALR